MNFLKKQSAGAVATCLTFLLGIVSYIVYRVNVGAAGYFQGAAVPQAQLYTMLGLGAALIVFILAQIRAGKAVNTIVDLIASVLRVLIPVLFCAAALTIVSSRVEGFAFIYFSNEEVLHEVQTAANMSSAHQAIASIVLLGVTAVVGMIAAFFNLTKKQKAA